MRRMLTRTSGSARRPAALTAAAGLLALATGLGTAQAAPQTSLYWNLLGGWGHKPGNSSVTSIASTSLTDAFAVGTYCAGTVPCSISTLEVQRWNGTKWLVIAPPAGLTTATGWAGTAVVAASSASNAWVFPQLNTTTSSHTDALRWNGKWATVTKFPAFSRIVTAATFSASNAWAFGTTGTSGTPFNLRYNGIKWQAAHPPGDPQALSAPAASDMWAIGPTIATATKPMPQQHLIAMHWNGTGWSTLALPNVSKPSIDFVTVGGIVALAPKNVWEFYGLGNFGTCCTFGGLEHWDGVKWHAVAVPYPVQVMTSIAADGHGGLWMIARTGTTPPVAFYHLNAGHWSRQYPPVFVNLTPVPAELSWIPGTGLLWAGGWGNWPAGSTAGVILSNGTP